MNIVGIPHRDGKTYDHNRDGTRLHAQHNRVLARLRDGEWWTLKRLAQATGDPEASISARIRDLRKPKFGNHVVERRYVAKGLWQYRLVTGQLQLIA